MPCTPSSDARRCSRQPDACGHVHVLVPQRPFHNAPIFRLLVKVTVNGRINVTSPISAGSNVQPPDVATARCGEATPFQHKHLRMPSMTTLRHCMPKALAVVSVSSHLLDSGVPAHGHRESSRCDELEVPGISRTATSCKLTWLVLG